MQLNPKVAEALNRQVNNELQASYVYVSMAAYFDANELPGFAAWFRAHSTEEIGHAMKLYDFLVKRNARVELTGVAKPDKDYASAEAALQAALDMECAVSEQIHSLFETAHETGEYGTQPLMHWFLEEQVNEEDLFRRLLEQVRAAGDSRWHLLVLDRDLGRRGGS